LGSRPYDSVYVVGDFNGWKPTGEALMDYEEQTERYVWKTTFRRGAYDYQYVVGSGDWLALEGNDWRTVNVYTALLFYRDTRYGGFDRIVGYAQRKSPGGSQVTSQ
jgi:hypothetical protein